MNQQTIVDLVKQRLGISSAVRDTYLAAIVSGVIDELTKQVGIVLDDENSAHLMFCVDYSTWRYQSRDSSGAMPRHLQYRLHNLIVSAGGHRGDV